MNLTSITEEHDVYLKHFYDSITPSFYYDFDGELSICDVGAGAGFPSIPLKIVFPELKVTIVDSLNKRIQFLNHLAAELGLQDVSLCMIVRNLMVREPTGSLMILLQHVLLHVLLY